MVLSGCELLLAALLTYAGPCYSIPPLVTAALAILGVAVLTLLVLAVKSARRRLLTVLGVFAVTVVVLALSLFLTLVMPEISPVPALDNRIVRILPSANHGRTFSVTLTGTGSPTPATCEPAGQQPQRV